jgi:hypothetical protein
MNGLGKILLFAVIAALCLSVPLLAQENAGTINGRVTDKSDAVIPGVTVTLTSPAIQGAKTSVTDEAGTYRFILLPPGTYALKYELPGFKTLLREGIIVQGSRTVTLPIALEVATVAETVTVTGESPVVDVQNATVGVAFNQNFLTNLPNQRDVWAVLGMTPGIAVKNFDVGSNSMGTQSNYRGYGVSGQVWITVDGVATTEGTSGAGMYYDYSSFSEITVQAAANSAEVAVPGVYTNTVMKTGSNNLHGQVYFGWDGSQTQGTNIDQNLSDKGLSTPDAFTRYNDFSANAGGPIKKDRFWWFGSFKEEYAALKTALLQNDATCCGQFTTRLGGQSVKLNYQLSPKNQAVWSMQRTTKVQPFRNGQGASAKNNIVSSTQDEEAWYMTNKGQFTSILSNRATLDTAWLWYHLFDPRFAHVQQTPYSDSATSIVRGAFGAENNTYRNRHQFYANLAYNANALGGNHDMKFGYGEIFETNGGKTDCEFNDAAHSSVPCVVLTYTTANGVISPNTIRIDNGPIPDKRNDLLNSYIFAQDKWTVKKLTMNLGVRFDRYHAWYPTSSNPGTGPFANATFFSTVQNTYQRRDMPVLNMLVPRVALVYDVFGNTKTAVKGSYGRYAENTGAGGSLLSNPITTSTATYTWTGTCTSYDSCSTLPITPAYLQTLKPTSTSAIAALPGIDPNLKDAYTDEYTAGIEQQIVNDVGFTGLFVRKIGHRAIGTLDTTYPTSVYTPVTGIDLGPDGVLGTPDDKQVTIYDRTVPTAAGTTRTLTNFDTGNNYSTVELTLTKRMSHNWQMLTGFDWTKYNESSIPNVSNASLPSGVTGSALDPNQFGPFQNNHWNQWTYKLEGTYLLPKGFHFSGILNSAKGANYSRTMQFSSALKNVVRNAAGVAGGNLAQGTLTVNVEPNAYYLPSTTLVNFRVDKELKFGDRQALQGVIDFSNPFNVNTITGVSSTTGTLKNPNNGQQIPNFGSVTTAISARTIKLGVRYSF